MLKKVLSISGKPGLFKMVSQGKNMYIVESLADKKRLPIYPRDKVVSLGDIAIYTDTEEVPLSKVLSSIYAKEQGVSANIKSNIQPVELRNYFSEILPDYDKERVYPSDMKKIMGWYNILVAAEMTNFEEKEGAEVQEKVEHAVEEKTETEKPVKKAEKPVKATNATPKQAKAVKAPKISKTKEV